MIFLVSPAKTFKDVDIDYNNVPVFNNKAVFLNDQLKIYNKEELKSLFKVSNFIVDSLYNYIHRPIKKSSAGYSYFGQVFKMLDLNNIDVNLFKDRFYILSAMYGILKPLDSIYKYRLDFTNTFLGNLYNYWSDDVNSYLKKHHQDEVIVSFCSNEFEKLLNIDYISISFIEGMKKARSMEAKTLRGLFLNYVLVNEINSSDELKKISLNNYSYNEELSSDKVYVFKKS